MLSLIERKPDFTAPSFHFFQGSAPVLFVSDHAGCETSAQWGHLGLTADEWHRHIGWDIGIKGVGRALSAHLKAPLVEQRFSRLLLDCNRVPEREDAIPNVSDETELKPNALLTSIERQARRDYIFTPYHDKIAEETQNLSKNFANPLFVSLHSFTPQMRGSSEKRKWDCGFLFHHDPHTAKRARDILREIDPALEIGMNEPYRLTPDKEYTVPRHAVSRNLRALEIEIRQDLIATPEGQTEWAQKLSRLIAELIKE